MNDFVFIINNKLHNYKYLKYTIIFYILIIHSYYTLYINLKKNNYMLILLYFIIVLIFYNKYNKFSYFIGYVYLLFTSYFINNKLIEGNKTSLRSRVNERRNNIQQKFDEDLEEAEGAPESTPAETYILKEISNRKLKVQGTEFKNPTSTNKVNTNLNITLPGSMNINSEISD